MKKLLALTFVMSSFATASFAAEGNKISYTPDGYIVSISKPQAKQETAQKAADSKANMVETAQPATNKTI